MVSTLEALERYPVPPSTAKLMSSAVSSHPSCHAVSRHVLFGERKAESEGRCAALAHRTPMLHRFVRQGSVVMAQQTA